MNDVEIELPLFELRLASETDVSEAKLEFDWYVISMNETFLEIQLVFEHPLYISTGLPYDNLRVLFYDKYTFVSKS